MRILFAADGSKYTKKALAFLCAQDTLAGPDDELVVLHVQPPLPPRVRTLVGAAVTNDYHRDEAEKVLGPIRKFLDRKGIPFHCEWKAGDPADQIVAGATRHKAHQLVMGTHGYGPLGRAVMGSVATRVLAQAHVPVLLVK